MGTFTDQASKASKTNSYRLISRPEPPTNHRRHARRRPANLGRLIVLRRLIRNQLQRKTKKLSQKQAQEKRRIGRWNQPYLSSSSGRQSPNGDLSRRVPEMLEICNLDLLDPGNLFRQTLVGDVLKAPPPSLERSMAPARSRLPTSPSKETDAALSFATPITSPSPSNSDSNQSKS